MSEHLTPSDFPSSGPVAFELTKESVSIFTNNYLHNRNGHTSFHTQANALVRERVALFVLKHWHSNCPGNCLRGIFDVSNKFYAKIKFPASTN